MYRKMFSSTTIASSMTMPVASDSDEHRHVVQREAERLHHREGADDRRRDGERRDDRDAQVADEQEDDERRQQAAEEQVVLDLLERLADEPRLVARSAWTLMSDGSVGLDPLEARQHPVDDRRPCSCPTACGSTARWRSRRRVLAHRRSHRRVWLRTSSFESVTRATSPTRDDRAVAVGQDDLLEVLARRAGAPSCASRSRTARR